MPLRRQPLPVIQQAVGMGCLLFASAAFNPTVAQEPDSVVRSLAAVSTPLATVAPGMEFEDLAPLEQALRGVQVVGLGEGTHGTHEFFLLKRRLFEFLVRRMGFRVLAFEGSQAAAEHVVDPYVQGGPGRVDSVVASLGLVGGWEEVRDLVQWMRTYNQDVPAADRVRFVGIDIQYNDAARDVVLAFLRSAAPERVDETEQLFEIPVDSLVYVPYLSRDSLAVAEALERLAPFARGYAEVLAYLENHRDELIARSSEDEFDRALRHARVLAQFADVYGRSPGDPSMNLARDRYLADNLQHALAAERPGTRAAVWAHNLHVMADSTLWNPWPLGRHLRRIHGDRYYAIGLSAGGAGALWACDISSDASPYWGLVRFDVPGPPLGTVAQDLDAVADRLGVRAFVLDIARARAAPGVEAWLAEPRGLFTVGSVYSPEWAAAYAYYQTRIPEVFDALAHIRGTSAARPLPFGECPDQIYR